MHLFGGHRIEIAAGIVHRKGEDMIAPRHHMVRRPLEPPGYNDPALRKAAGRNLQLQAILAAQEPSPEIDALYRRMNARDSRFVGDTK